MIDVLFQCLDALEEYNTNIRESADEGTNDNEPLIKQLNEIMNEGKDGAESSSSEEAPAASQTASATGGKKRSGQAGTECLRAYSQHTGDVYFESSQSFSRV